MMIRCTFSIFLFCVIFLVEFSEEAPSRLDEVLLVISYDGFRPEYLHRHVTPNLNEFREESTWAQFMRPVFPTKTFVNHFSIATVNIEWKHEFLVWKMRQFHFRDYMLKNTEFLQMAYMIKITGI